MATHWLPVPQLDQSELRAIVRAWVDVFPESSLWIGSGGDWILLGVREGGRPVSEEEFRRPWQDPRVGAELRDLGVESPEQLGALFVLDGEGMLDLVGDIPPLVDDFPYQLSPRGGSWVRKRESRYPVLLDPRPRPGSWRAGTSDVCGRRGCGAPACATSPPGLRSTTA
jgi:hypothetical protein